MPVNLPLPPPTEVAPPALRASLPTPSLELRVGPTRLLISLPPGVPAAAVRDGLAGAADAADVLRRLPYLAIAAGQLSVRSFQFTDRDGTLNIWLLSVPLTAVSGDPPLKTYFEFLTEAKTPLTPARLEPARSMAGLHSNRAGLSVDPRLLPDGEGLRLHLPAVADGRRGTVRVAAGNPGNRYVGKRFVDLDARLASRSGSELGLFLRESDRLFQGGQADYHEQGLSASQYHPLGLFGLGARRFEYRVREPEQALLDGEQTQYELSWLAIPRADFRARWTTELKLDYVSQSLHLNADQSLVRRERYPSLAATVQRTATATLAGRRLDYDLSLLLRQGLGGTPNPSSDSDVDYRLGRLGLGARWRLLPTLAIETQLAGQWSDDRLPDAQLWALGGPQFVRAYYPGAALGDRGAYARVSALSPRPPIGNWQLTPAAHLEWGRSDRAGSTDATLADAALSLDVRYGRIWSANLGSALPFVENGDPRLLDGARAGFFFRVQADF